MNSCWVKHINLKLTPTSAAQEARNHFPDQNVRDRSQLENYQHQTRQENTSKLFYINLKSWYCHGHVCSSFLTGLGPREGYRLPPLKRHGFILLKNIRQVSLSKGYKVAETYIWT
jgi:hypothetical protein